MTKYREILRLKTLGLSQQKIADSCKVSKKTVNVVLKLSDEHNLKWPLEETMTDAEIEKILYPQKSERQKFTQRKLPDYEYIRNELLKNGVNKKLLWTEYVQQCKNEGSIPLMYSQFCYYIQTEEQTRRATMHIVRTPGEQIEVDWAGDPAYITDPVTGDKKKTFVFVGALSYSLYAYAEAFPDEKQRSWNTAHVHMFEYFGGVSKILIPDNCKTAVDHNRRFENELNQSYQDLAEHYGTAIIPARVRTPKDKPNAENNVCHISTWIIAALRNEQFFSLYELNTAVKEKLEEYNTKEFQKKGGSRKSLFELEEKQFLLPLPPKRFENSMWRSFKVQFNYHISFEGNLYSVPYTYIKKQVDVKITDSVIEIFFEGTRIASHMRIYGKKGQYSTEKLHMPQDHQEYLEWNGDRFRRWARTIGVNTLFAVDFMLKAARVEQQAYKGCMGVLSLSKKYSPEKLEDTCSRLVEMNVTPSYRNISAMIVSSLADAALEGQTQPESKGFTRGADYYRNMEI